MIHTADKQMQSKHGAGLEHCQSNPTAGPRDKDMHARRHNQKKKFFDASDRFTLEGPQQCFLVLFFGLLHRKFLQKHGYDPTRDFFFCLFFFFLIVENFCDVCAEKRGRENIQNQESVHRILQRQIRRERRT